VQELDPDALQSDDMPRALIVLPMSFEAYERMEQRLGWKHEYWDGAARLSPQESAVGTFRRRLDSALVSHWSRHAHECVRVAHPDDAPALVELFLHAFDDAVEFAGWPERHYHRNAHETVASFFGGPDARQIARPGRRESSFVVASNDRLLAALLVRSSGSGPIVEPVMVHSAHRRHGLASALLAVSIEALRNDGETVLLSRCHLGNPPGLGWHEASGFEEVPSYFSATHRWHHQTRLAGYFEITQQPDKAARAREMAEQWKAIAEQLSTSDQ
jgi:GNAT superfamily N-acetyltransferase